MASSMILLLPSLSLPSSSFPSPARPSRRASPAPLVAAVPANLRRSSKAVKPFLLLAVCAGKGALDRAPSPATTAEDEIREEEEDSGSATTAEDEIREEEEDSGSAAAAARKARKESERRAYLAAAVLSSVGITSAAAVSVFYRFHWQMEGGGAVSMPEVLGTFALSIGAAVGMEYWARWAHRALWHASLWHVHVSHHRPRVGPFEANDIFAIINAAPAISLLAYGFSNRGLFPGLCYGAGLGITIFGMAYMFVHDGLVHRRFPVGPIANVPYFRRVAAAHQIHHSDKFNGVPYGLFLGPNELEMAGELEELEKEIRRRAKVYKDQPAETAA